MDIHPAAMISLIVGGAFALAWVAVIVSKQANTTGVIQSAASGLGTIIGAATAPVTGQNPNLGSYNTSANPLQPATNQ